MKTFPGPVPSPDVPSARSSKLWLWVVAVCVVQAAVWTAWLTYAARHPVAEVPLATAR